jgi:hypothetical protein
MFFNRMKKILKSDEVPMVEVPVVQVVSKEKKSPAKTTAKAAVKKAVKKTAVKKAASAEEGETVRLPLRHAEDEKAFWVNDGKILKNLTELAETFAEMDTIVYRYHVATKRNDFADWVEHVLCDEECAAALRCAKTPKTAHTVVVRRLTAYDI